MNAKIANHARVPKITYIFDKKIITHEIICLIHSWEMNYFLNSDSFKSFSELNFLGAYNSESIFKSDLKGRFESDSKM